MLNPYILMQTYKCIMNQVEIYLLREPIEIYVSITKLPSGFWEIKSAFFETSKNVSYQMFDLDNVKICNVDENALVSMRGN